MGRNQIIRVLLLSLLVPASRRRIHQIRLVIELIVFVARENRRMTRMYSWLVVNRKLSLSTSTEKS
jgi:hypothetical protein